MLSIVESLESVEKTINQLNNEIKTSSTINSGNICKMKWKICQLAQRNGSLQMSRNGESYYDNVKSLDKFFFDTRSVDKM